VGRLTDVTDRGVTLDGEREIEWSAIATGRIEVEFGRPAGSDDELADLAAGDLADGELMEGDLVDGDLVDEDDDPLDEADDDDDEHDEPEGEG
jgi:hypothetical protein